MKRFFCWAVLGVATGGGVAACREPIAPEPARDLYGTYDLVLLSPHDPLPFISYDRINYNRLDGGTLILGDAMDFAISWDAVGNLWTRAAPPAGTYWVSGDSIFLADVENYPLRREGPALVGEAGDVWVKRGAPVPPQFRYDTYEMVASGVSGPPWVYSGYLWLWEDESFWSIKDTGQLGITGAGGTYEIRSDTLLVLSTGLAVTDASSGVLKDGVLRIGPSTYHLR